MNDDNGDKMSEMLSNINSSNRERYTQPKIKEKPSMGWLGWIIAALSIAYFIFSGGLTRARNTINSFTEYKESTAAISEPMQPHIASTQVQYIDLRTISTYDFLQEYRRRLSQDTNDRLIQQELTSWQSLKDAAEKGAYDSKKYELLSSAAESLCYVEKNETDAQFRELKTSWANASDGMSANTEGWLKKHAIGVCQVYKSLSQ